jgi:hypothetical protein
MMKTQRTRPTMRVGPWRVDARRRVVTHADYAFYEVDLDRIRSEADALEWLTHVGRHRLLFDHSDVGALSELFDALGLIGAGSGDTTPRVKNLPRCAKRKALR